MFTRRIVGIAAMSVLAPLAFAAVPAQAVEDSTSRITVRVSDPTPNSGEQFVARGKFTVDGQPADDHVVKVQAWRDGEWKQLTGARMLTNDEGRYRMRLILSQKGERLLRVVGVGQDDEPNARKRFTVVVQ